MAKSRATLSVPGAAVSPAVMQLGVPIPSATPAVKPAGKRSLADLMKQAKGGGATVATKETKAGTPVVTVSEELMAKIKSFVRGAAKKKSAESDMADDRPEIEAAMAKLIVSRVRADNAFIKSVDVQGVMTFTNGKLDVERPTAARSLEAIEKDLRGVLGDMFDKYIKPGMTLSIKASALEGFAKTEETLAFLQGALGTRFGELFEFGGYLDLHEVTVGGEATSYLTHDFVVNPVFAEQVAPAMAKGLIRNTFVTLKPSTAAIAHAGEELAAEQQVIIDALRAKKAEKQ